MPGRQKSKAVPRSEGVSAMSTDDKGQPLSPTEVRKRGAESDARALEAAGLPAAKPVNEQAAKSEAERDAEVAANSIEARAAVAGLVCIDDPVARKKYIGLNPRINGGLTTLDGTPTAAVIINPLRGSVSSEYLTVRLKDGGYDIPENTVSYDAVKNPETGDLLIPAKADRKAA